MNSPGKLTQLLWQQKWISLKLKKPLYKKLVAQGEIPDAPFEKDFYGLRYEGNLSNSIEYNIFYFGAFEKPLLHFMRDALRSLKEETTLFCDIGANIGQHSLFMSQFATKVESFEPYTVVSDRLKHHIELNNIDNIALHSIGLSDANAEMDFYAPTGRNQGIGSFDSSTLAKGNRVAGQLELVKGDDYFTARNIKGISLMKIDVEGFERPALLGLSETLKQERPIVIVEVSYTADLAFKDLADFKAALPTDYELFTFDTRKRDGSKARKRGSKAKRTGEYDLVTFSQWRQSGQDDIIACPAEKIWDLPQSSAKLL